jgi:hypothetical protein
MKLRSRCKIQLYHHTVIGETELGCSRLFGSNLDRWLMNGDYSLVIEIQEIKNVIMKILRSENHAQNGNVLGSPIFRENRRNVVW